MYNKPRLTKHDQLRNITFSAEYGIKITGDYANSVHESSMHQLGIHHGNSTRIKYDGDANISSIVFSIEEGDPYEAAEQIRNHTNSYYDIEVVELTDSEKREIERMRRAANW